MTPTMRCIDGVAAIVRGEVDGKVCIKNPQNFAENELKNQPIRPAITRVF